MKRFIVFLSFLFPFLSSSQNLLVNGGFEDENICTEYHEPCAPEGWFGNTGGFKNYFIDSGFAQEGSHYLAIEAGRTRNKYQRSYTRTQLLCNLRTGNKYRLQFFLKSANNILDSIGVYFTPYDFILDKNLLYKIEPTAYVIDENKPVPGNTGWQKITFAYTATGNEKYLTIANFSKRDINGETGLPLETHFFVYLDGVSLSPLNPDEKLCGDWEKAKMVIYQVDDRHEFFERYVRFYRSQNKIAEPPKLSLTRIYKTEKLVLKDGQFITGRSNLQQAGYAALDSFCNNLTSRTLDNAEIGSYAGDTGDEFATDEIAVQRAALVKEYIRRKLNLEENKIKIDGMQQGPSSSIKTSTPGQGRKRRVELLIYVHE
ncbi:MAG: OmpA/MotB domain protein [Chitinophagaceae bacterium]|nr:OmpA/MotB domain protein [Chitinophagaceae bacterium]